MRFFDLLSKIASFENTPEEFELLETEKGEPGFWGGWKEEAAPEAPENIAFPSTLSGCEKQITTQFRRDINSDLVLRRFRIGGKLSVMAAFINGMVDTQIVNNFILRDGMRGDLSNAAPPYAEYLLENVLTHCEAQVEHRWDKAKKSLLDGKTVLFLEGESCCIVLDTRGYAHRDVSVAENEKVIIGPQESFTENLRTNITLLRRIIRKEDLVVEFRDAGAENHIRTAIVYREGLTNANLVEEVKHRLANVKTDMLLHIGTLEQITEKHKHIPFPQLLTTERPDRAAAQLMQGHVVVLLEGSPYANVMPTTLHTLMSSPEDSYIRSAEGSLIRIVRTFGALVSILVPGCFLSLTLFHPGLLSSEVLNTIVTTRRMVFEPLGLEMLSLSLIFQLIREAGLRVPGAVGQAIGIIGGLLLGQAAIAANLASPIILIVVALAGLGNFCVPDYSLRLAVSYLRILFVIAAWMAGLLGVICTLIIMIALLSSLKSYGVPFLTPFAPKTYSKQPMVLRGTVNMHKRAQDYMNTRKDRRQ